VHEVLALLLRPGGCALVAAKRYYFGVGGGVEGFAEALSRPGEDNNSANFAPAQSLATFDDGASNVRELLLLRRL